MNIPTSAMHTVGSNIIMKHLLYISVLLFQSYFLCGQGSDKKYDADYYEKLIQQGDSCNYHNNFELINLYLRDDKVFELKKTLERYIKCPLINSRQRGLYLQLADIYFKEKSYNKTLDLIKLYQDTEHKVVTPHNPYRYSSNFTLSLKKSKCYEGLNLNDSAISALTPYIFHKFEVFDGYYDSTSFANICDNYLNLLLKKHSINQIKKELTQSEIGFYFNHIPERNDKFGFIDHMITCGFKFFTPVIFLSTGIRNNSETYEDIRFTKDYQLKLFKESELYKKIKTL
jgi:hypothetical protein